MQVGRRVLLFNLPHDLLQTRSMSHLTLSVGEIARIGTDGPLTLFSVSVCLNPKTLRKIPFQIYIAYPPGFRQIYGANGTVVPI